MTTHWNQENLVSEDIRITTKFAQEFGFINLTAGQKTKRFEKISPNYPANRFHHVHRIQQEKKAPQSWKSHHKSIMHPNCYS